MSEKKQKKWWQRIFRDNRDMFILVIEFGIGLLVSLFAWYVVIAVFSFIFGFSLNKFLGLRKKEPDDKK